jgi:hypothetical protein
VTVYENEPTITGEVFISWNQHYTTQQRNQMRPSGMPSLTLNAYDEGGENGISFRGANVGETREMIICIFYHNHACIIYKGILFLRLVSKCLSTTPMPKRANTRQRATTLRHTRFIRT